MRITSKEKRCHRRGLFILMITSVVALLLPTKYGMRLELKDMDFTIELMSNQKATEDATNEIGRIKPVSNQVENDKSNNVMNVEDIVEPKKHWCVVDHSYMPATSREFFMHFPHALETLLPCWSLLRHAMDTEAGDTCGILSTTPHEWFGPWQTEFIEQGMKCDIQHFPIKYSYHLPLYEEVPAKFNTTELFSPVRQKRDKKAGYWLPENSVFHVPNVYLSRPRQNHYHYIDDKEDAHALRRSFISDFDIAKMKGPDKSIQIGIIKRERNRRITNLADLKRGIQDHFINANVTVTNFDFKTVKEQASWFATKDIIVAAHGACLANSLFITPKTIVLVIYPPQIMYQTLEPLVEQAGGIALDWYNSTETPRPLMTTYGLDRSGWNSKLHVEEFDVDVEEIVGRLHFATATKPTYQELKTLWKKNHIRRNNAETGELVW